MHTIERSMARMGFHLDGRLEKVQSGTPVRFRGHIGELGEGFVRNEFLRATVGNTSTHFAGQRVNQELSDLYRHLIVLGEDVYNFSTEVATALVRVT